MKNINYYFHKTNIDYPRKAKKEKIKIKKKNKTPHEDPTFLGAKFTQAKGWVGKILDVQKYNH